MTGIAVALAVLPASAGERLQSVADLIETLQPSVVNITITRHAKTSAAAGNIVSQDSASEKRVQSSGFFVDESGVVLTNRHVIADATEIIVTLHDATRLRASVMAAATTTDIALLKVNAGKQVPALKFGNSDILRPGDPVFIIGNPLGLGSTVTAGIVSALDRNTPDSETASFFQIDAALNVGNSGGPVFDTQGNVVGVSTALVTPENQAGSVGLGLAIPGNDVRFTLDRLLKFGRVQLGWIGIHVEPVTTDIMAAVGIPSVGGSIVTKVDDDSPAARAQLGRADIILKVDGDNMPGPRELNRKIASSAIGSVSRVGVWRTGTLLTIPVTVGDLPSNGSLDKPVVPDLNGYAQLGRPDLGLILAPLTDDARAKLAISAQQPGVLVEDVVAHSVASDRGITAGSVIVSVERQSVTSSADVLRSLDDARQSNRRFVLLLVLDAQSLRWVPLPLG